MVQFRVTKPAICSAYLSFSKLSVSPKLVELADPTRFMEETDMCHATPIVVALQQAIPNGCPAKTLGPSQRLTVAVQALAGHQTITDLADDFNVSRKFVYQQAALAQDALQDAFAAADVADDQLLFQLPVTKAWLRQVTLGLVLICHSSLRGVIEFCRDLLAVPLALGTVHNILHSAVDQARACNQRPSLANIDIPALDEIFQSRQPVLVGADVASGYCFLLSLEESRNAETWAIRLLELQDRGLAPTATIADFGTGLRAGQKLALPNVPCRGDVFHALQETTLLVTYLENRAYNVMASHHQVQRKKTKTKKQGDRGAQGLGKKAFLAGQAEGQAVLLADDIALLARWLRHDILAVSGLPYGDRCALFDFVVDELKARQDFCAHRIGRVRTLLKNHRADLLAFAAQLDGDLTALAKEYQVAVETVRELLDVQALEEHQARRWQHEAALRQQLGERFRGLSAAVKDVAEHAVRASSVIENLNSRLRPYFFLRRQLGADYLALLQFFLNHRSFLRSEHPERVGKSPAELLTGETHPHWLEMLGYQRFSLN
jgi:hypothetical protein